MSRWLQRLIGITALLQSGCAAWYLNGAQEHVGAPTEYVARFVIRSCITTDGQEGAGPADTWYYLVQDARGPILYELDGTGEGSEVTNRWSDDNGQHFFVWVSGSHGWVYTFFHDRSQLPLRRVFPAGSYTIRTTSEGIAIPSGQPQATCSLVPT